MDSMTPDLPALFPFDRFENTPESLRVHRGARALPSPPADQDSQQMEKMPELGSTVSVSRGAGRGAARSAEIRLPVVLRPVPTQNRTQPGQKCEWCATKVPGELSALPGGAERSWLRAGGG